MAETATGMNIKADASIVAAAGNLATAQQPFSMKGMTDNFVEARGEFLNTQNEKFAANMKDIDALSDGVKKAIADLETQLNDGTIDLQSERDALQLQVDGYRDRLKEVPRGKKGKGERDQILYEVNKLVKGRQKTSDAAEDVIDIVSNNKYDPKMFSDNPGYLGLIEQLALDAAGKDTTDATFNKRKNLKGEDVYSYVYKQPDGEGGYTDVPVEGTIFEIQDMLKEADKQSEYVVELNEMIHGYQLEGSQSKGEFSDIYNKVQNGMETSFNNSPGGFKAAIHSKIGWAKNSYVETLNDSNSEEYQNIISTLSELDISKTRHLDLSGPDGKPDGVVNAEDFASPENAREIIRALTNPKPGERGVAHALAAQFYADTEARKAYGFGEDTREPEGGDGGGDNTDAPDPNNPYGFGIGRNSLNMKVDIKVGEFAFQDGEGATVTSKKNVTSTDVEIAVNSFKRIEAEGVGTLGTWKNGHTYKYDNQQWWVMLRNESEWNRTRRDEVMNDHMFLGNTHAQRIVGGDNSTTVYGHRREVAADGTVTNVSRVDKQALKAGNIIIDGRKYGKASDYTQNEHGNWLDGNGEMVLWKVTGGGSKNQGWTGNLPPNDNTLMAALLNNQTPASTNTNVTTPNVTTPEVDTKTYTTPVANNSSGSSIQFVTEVDGTTTISKKHLEEQNTMFNGLIDKVKTDKKWGLMGNGNISHNGKPALYKKDGTWRWIESYRKSSGTGYTLRNTKFVQAYAKAIMAKVK